MVAADLSDLVQRLSPLFREIQCILSPIALVRFPLNKSAAFQFVQYRHQSAGMDPQFPRQFLLTDAGLEVKQPQNARIRRRQTHDSQPFRKLGSGMTADLGE